MKKRAPTPKAKADVRAKAAGKAGRGRKPAKPNGGNGKTKKATKSAEERQAEKDRKLLEAELRRREDARLRAIDRREIARLKLRMKRKRSRWEKRIDAKAHKAYLKKLPTMWWPNLKYRFIPRVGEPPEEMPIRKKAEKRAFREYKKYRSNLKRDPQTVRHERTQGEVAMYLQNRFPGWIMEDAIAAGIWKIWYNKSRRPVRRKIVRWRAYKVHQALCPRTRQRAQLIDAARKRGVKLTREEIEEQLIQFHSVQQLAIEVEIEHSSEKRWETQAETLERLLADSPRGRSMETPLDEIEMAEAPGMALNGSGLDGRERAVVGLLWGGRSQKDIADELDLDRGHVSRIAKRAAEKMGIRLGLRRELCYFGHRKQKKDGDNINAEHC